MSTDQLVRPELAPPPSPASQQPHHAELFTDFLSGLPLGNRLGAEDFANRHRLAQLVAWGLLVLLAMVSISMGDDIGHFSVELIPMALALLVANQTKSQVVAALSCSAALMFACAFLVHATDGLVESHFLFFVLLPLIALYQDIKAFVLAVGFVVFHHAVVGILAPEAVYNHPAAIANPVKYGALHGAYVVGLVIVLTVEWSFSERAQRLALSRATELELMQTELVQAQKLESVGQLAAGIAHEINTPMQYIGDNTHFLKNTITRLLTIAEAAQTATQPNATPQDQQHLADLIAKSKLPLLAERAPQAADDALTGVENVSRIVTAMKRFSHPGTTDMAPVDLNDSIATTMTVCRNEWKYAADITTDFNELPPTEAHLGELNQVWLNLIVNAAHAITEHTTNTPGHTGHITITTTHQPDHNTNTITITDNGNGIPEDHLTRVLDPFFTTKDVGKGTGQGLTIAHNVITKDHNGTLTITSTQGAGTTITITLPTTQPTPTKDN